MTESTIKREAFIFGVELHDKLQVKMPYAIWILKKLDAGLENIYYWREWNGDVPKLKSELISLDLAKEICLAENTEIGFKVFMQLKKHETEKRLDAIFPS